MGNMIEVIWEDDNFLRTPDDVVGLNLESVNDQEINLSDDPLVLSCTSHRIWRENSWRRWSRLEEVVDDVTDADRKMAEDIRGYYTSKFVFARLSNKALTAFQRDLSNFLTNKKPLTHKDLGLVYSVPYFYQEDCENDVILDGANTAEDTEFKVLHELWAGQKLTPVREVFAYRKSGDRHLFWFKNERNQAVVIEVEARNKMLKLFRSLFKLQQIELGGTARTYTANNKRYYRLSNVELTAND